MLVDGKVLDNHRKVQRMQSLRPQMPAWRYLRQTGRAVYYRGRQMHRLSAMPEHMQIFSYREGVIYREDKIKNDHK